MFTLPFPDAAVSLHTADLGMTGSGKSSTGKLIIENRVKVGYRVCVLDTLKSDHWGLTVSADGKSPGLPFTILGGPHAHLPIEPAHGTAVGALVANGTIPLSIIDMARFPPGGVAKFFVGFAEALRQNMEGVLYLVMEEAHVLAPKERSGMGDENAALHYSKMLATGGRSMGVRLIVMTQRVQSLHNAVLSSCQTLIAHRLQFPADQGPVIKWLKANAPKDRQAEIIDSLATLKVGEAWVCAPSIEFIDRLQMPPIMTFDNSATPKAGEKRVEPKALASADLDPIREALAAALPKPALAKSERQKQSITPDPAAMAEAEQRGYERGKTEGFAAGRQDGRESAARELISTLPDWIMAMAGTSRAPQPPPAVEKRSLKQSPKFSAESKQPTSGIPGAAGKMLRVMDTDPPVKRTWLQVATLAGLKARGGHFNSGKKYLLQYRLVEEAGVLVWIREPTVLASTKAISRGEQIEMWAGVLSGAAPRLLRELANQDRAISRSSVAEILGMQPRGGHWNDGWKQLRDNGLVRVDGDIATLQWERL